MLSTNAPLFIVRYPRLRCHRNMIFGSRIGENWEPDCYWFRSIVDVTVNCVDFCPLYPNASDVSNLIWWWWWIRRRRLCSVAELKYSLFLLHSSEKERLFVVFLLPFSISISLFLSLHISSSIFSQLPSPSSVLTSPKT